MKRPILGNGFPCPMENCSTPLQCYPPPENGGTLENGVVQHLRVVHRLTPEAALTVARRALDVAQP